MLQSLMGDGGLAVLLCGVAPVVIFMSLHLLVERRSTPAKRKRRPVAMGRDYKRSGRPRYALALSRNSA